MARKFVDAEEAAKMLSISVEKLNEMRDRHEVYPVRDGGQWKYKFDDVERLIAERNAAPDEVELPSDYEDEGGLDSILLSEVELGHSGHSPSSTVIGKGGASSSDSDIQLATDNPKGEKKPDKKSDKKLVAPLSRLPDSPSELPSPGSDVRLASGSSSDSLKPGSGLSKKFDDLDTLDLELPPALSSGSDRINTGPSSGILALDEASLSLEGEPHSKAGGGSSQRAAGSAIDLSGQDDDDLVLGGGSSGSDLTHSSGGDSGISLIDPSDSGLALDDEALEVKAPHGSSKTSLNLGGDDDLILLEEEADPNVATQLKADDDFLLTPMDDGGGQDSDSGSQVIALDSESDFDESAATMLGRRGQSAGMLEADEDFSGGGFAAVGGPALGMAPAGMPMVSSGAMMAGPQVEEAPFSVWNVLFLMICVVFLVISGMMMYDLLRNMWSWDGPYRVNSSLMDSILEMFEK